MRARRATRGFSLVELAIAVALLGLVSGGVLMVFDSTNRAFQSANASIELSRSARRTVDRLAEIVAYSRRSSVSPAAPGAQAPFSTRQIDFQTAQAFAGGAAVWSNTQRLEFRYSPFDPDDGVDNDRNGVIDDGQVVWTTDLGLAEERSVVLARGVRELQARELANGADDDANGLIDEPGLCFDFDGQRIVVRLTLERVLAGRRLTRSAVRSVTFRNNGP
jgi:prepilin-type N-terminal cleavage/methylation domain-containing protein